MAKSRDGNIADGLCALGSLSGVRCDALIIFLLYSFKSQSN